jgi:beta-aspartyl-peptidase (threonine type)
MASGTQRWALIVHGGARTIDPGQEAENRAGIKEALDAGTRALARGEKAVDVAETVVRALEDNPAFNAGLYGVMNSDGKMQLDAAIMDGTTLDIGAVAALEGIRYPVSVARKLLREKTVFLAGAGAKNFADAHGVEPLPDDVCAPKGKHKGHDTVGCVVLDNEGNIAVAVSTGGLEGKMPGRVGDSPLSGCGFYAESTIGGVCFSGEGEAVIRSILAARAMADIEALSPQQAMDRAVGRVAALQAEAGGIALDTKARIGWSHNSAHFAVGYQRAGAEPHIHLQRTETHFE